jgi:hypothetical protein
MRTMSNADALSPPPVGPGAHDHAMRRLAQRLRGQRLTLLVVPPGVDMHALLKQRLMLLLGRRDSDVDLLAGAPTPARTPMAERRQQRQSETTAFFDDWAQMARSGALDWRPPGADDRVLLVMPQLGDCLRAAGADAAAQRWLQALVQAYWALDGRAQRPVQLLLAIDSASLPLLELLRLQGLPVDALLLHWLTDGRLQEATPPSTSTSPSPGLAAAAAPGPAAAAPARRRKLPDPGPPQPLHKGSVGPAGAATAAAPPGALQQPRLANLAPAVAGLAGAGLLVLALGIAGPFWQPAPAGPPTLRLATADSSAAPAAPAPPMPPPHGAVAATAWPLMVAAGPGGLPQPVVELAGRVGPSAGLWLAPQLLGDWAEGLHRLRAGPGLLVLRYDALRAAQQADPALAPRLLTPLYTEPLLAIVRSSSALTGLQQLRGQRLRVAAAGSADAHSASMLLQALFGTAAPALLHAPAGTAAALPLADDEVLLTVGRPGRPWTDALPPGLQGQYRLLALAAADARSPGALQQHLPVQVDGPDGPVSTLGVMSFLAAAPAATASGDDTAALLRLARALCRELPALQHSGDAAWRGWQPGQPPTSGWPTLAAAAAVWQQCGQPPASPGVAVLADAGRNTTAGDNRLVSTDLKGQP